MCIRFILLLTAMLGTAQGALILQMPVTDTDIKLKVSYELTDNIGVTLYGGVGAPSVNWEFSLTVLVSQPPFALCIEGETCVSLVGARHKSNPHPGELGGGDPVMLITGPLPREGETLNYAQMTVPHRPLHFDVWRLSATNPVGGNPIITVEADHIPEPGTLSLFIGGSLVALFLQRKRFSLNLR